MSGRVDNNHRAGHCRREACDISFCLGSVRNTIWVNNRNRVADTDGVSLASDAQVADIDVVAANGQMVASAIAQCGVLTGACTARERVLAISRVVAAVGIEIKRMVASSSILVADCITRKRAAADGGVVGASVARKCIVTDRRVGAAGRVAKERLKTAGRVVVAAGVVIERLKTNSRVLAAVVGENACESKESVGPLRSVVDSVASIGQWTNRSCRWRKREAGKRGQKNCEK